MPVFTYRAADRAGRRVEGRMEAQDAGLVAARLQELNFYPLGIRQDRSPEGEERGVVFENPFRRSGKAVLHLTGHLSQLLSAGLPLDRCLAIVTDLVDDRPLRAAVVKVRRSVEEGNSLADSLAKHPRYFDGLYVSMVRAGEASGTLDRIMLRLSKFMEEWQKIRDAASAAMTYPAFLMTFTLAVVVLILTVVVPKFSVVFSDVDRSIPAATAFVLAVSAAIRDYWWAVLLGIASAAGSLFLYFRSGGGREWRHRRVLDLPIFGPLIVKIQVARFARLLGTLIQGGVPILGALEIVTDTLTNPVFSRSVARVKSGLKEGQGIAEPLRRAGVFPPLFLHMVTVGEETGRLEEMLLSVADGYDRDIERDTRRLLSLLEPIIIIFMGVIVGAIVLSLLYGIVSMNQIAF